MSNQISFIPIIKALFGNKHAITVPKWCRYFWRWRWDRKKTGRHWRLHVTLLDRISRKLQFSPELDRMLTKFSSFANLGDNTVQEKNCMFLIHTTRLNFNLTLMHVPKQIPDKLDCSKFAALEMHELSHVQKKVSDSRLFYGTHGKLTFQSQIAVLCILPVSSRDFFSFIWWEPGFPSSACDTCNQTNPVRSTKTIALASLCKVRSSVLCQNTYSAMTKARHCYVIFVLFSIVSLCGFVLGSYAFQRREFGGFLIFRVSVPCILKKWSSLQISKLVCLGGGLRNEFYVRS